MTTTTKTKKSKIIKHTQDGQTIDITPVEVTTTEVVVHEPPEVIEYLGKVGLSEKPAGKEIVAVLKEFYTVFEEWEKQAETIIVTDVSHKEQMALARKGRLILRDKRNRMEEAFDAQRKIVAARMAEDKLVDTTWLKVFQLMAAKFTALESSLLTKEEFEKRIEDAKKLKIKNERIDKMTALGAPISAYKFDEMTDEVWEGVYNGALKAKKDAEDAETLRKEKQAETERLAKSAKELQEKNAELEKKNVVLETVVASKGYSVPVVEVSSPEKTFYNDNDLADKEKLQGFVKQVENLDYKYKFVDKKTQRIFDKAVDDIQSIVETICDHIETLE